jgi:hypothetical protein
VTVVAVPELLLILTVDVPVVLKLVVVAIFHKVPPAALQVIDPVVPNANTRVFELLEANNPVVRARLFKFSVPAVSVVVAVAGTVSALPKVNVWDVPSNVTGADSVTAFVVMVPVPVKVITPVADHTVVEDRVKLPATVRVPALLNVNDEPVVVIDFAFKLPVNVTVPEPELASKMTGSKLVGTKAPLVPPEVSDQLVVLEVSHVPVPPTQYKPLPEKVQPVLFPWLSA